MSYKAILQAEWLERACVALSLYKLCLTIPFGLCYWTNAVQTCLNAPWTATNPRITISCNDFPMLFAVTFISKLSHLDN